MLWYSLYKAACQEWKASCGEMLLSWVIRCPTPNTKIFVMHCCLINSLQMAEGKVMNMDEKEGNINHITFLARAWSQASELCIFSQAAFPLLQAGSPRPWQDWTPTAEQQHIQSTLQRGSPKSHGHSYLYLTFWKWIQRRKDMNDQITERHKNK